MRVYLCMRVYVDALSTNSFPYLLLLLSTGACKVLARFPTRVGFLAHGTQRSPHTRHISLGHGGFPFTTVMSTVTGG